ncbi:MAG: metallophosphoesterase [bacterium]|nr:metallophosphoesterase [bacterium]
MRFLMQLLVLTLSWSPVGLAKYHFLTVTDIHYGAENQAMDGQDTGPVLFKEMLKEFSILSKQADFIIHLGDMPTHSFFNYSAKEDYERVVFHGLFAANSAKKPIFYITGNNDSLTGNYQPFQYEHKSPLNFANDWTGSCAYCDGLMVDKTYMRSGGFYSSYVMPGNKEILLIALNTIPWSTRPILLPKYPNQEADAEREFVWLEQQLKKHSAKQLLIAMHIPPGKSYKNNLFWQEQYLNRFITLLQQNHQAYQEITLLTAHTHMDELRVLHLKEGANIYAYSTPAVSRIHYNNPGMKLFSLNNEMAITNYITFYTSSFKKWANEHYQAIGNTSAIFPSCQTHTLALCFNSLTAKEVCADLEDKFYYGAKSSRVAAHVCRFTYEIN